MTKKRAISLISVFCLTSALAFAVVTKEQVQSAILGVKAGVLVLTGNCQGQDQARIQDLLALFRGCQLTEKQSKVAAWERPRHCINTLIQKWTSIENFECKSPMRRPIERLLIDNVLKQWRWVTEATDKTELETRLLPFLDHLSFWENKTRPSIYLAHSDREENGLNNLYQDLTLDINEVHSEMARGLFNSLKASITDWAAFVTKKFVEKESPFSLVMRTLLRQKEPGPVSLVQFTAMTLYPLLERAKLFLNLYDLSCSLSGHCHSDNYTSSEPYLILYLTSLIGQDEFDGPLFRDALNRLAPANREVFEVLFNERAFLLKALRSGMKNQEVQVSDGAIEQFEPLAFYLVSTLKEAEQLVNTVNRTGRFLPLEREYLGPFTQDGLDQANQILTQLKTSLDTKVTRYSAHTREQLEALDRINETTQRKENTEVKLNQIGLELSMAEMDLQGLQAALRNENDSVGKLVSRSTQLISQKEYQDRFATGSMVPILSQVLEISARDAKFSKQSLPATLEDIVVAERTNGKIRLRLKKGDLVSAEITGQYAPTCAIAKEYTGIKGLEDSLTGPEGFILSSADRTLKVNSATETTGDRQTSLSTHQHTEHLKGCGSTTVGKSVSVSAGASFIVGGSVTVSASVSHTFPHDCTDQIDSTSKATEVSQTTSTTSNKELNQTASFERGMRSSFAPFPALPVGSLVAVELDPATNQVLNTRVLHRNTVFSATQDADLVLVVNDCKNDQARQDALDLKLVQSRSAVNESVVTFLMDTVAQVSADLQTKLPVFLEQGDVSSSDLITLERDLRNEVELRVISGNYGAFRLKDFPLIDELVGTWISTELAQLERRVKIRHLERRIQLLTLKYNDLRNQSLKLDRSFVIREMISDSVFRSLDFKELLAEVARITQFLDYRVLPVLDTVLPGIAKTAGHDFATFMNGIDLNTDLEVVSQQLLGLVDRLNFAQVITLRARTQNKNKVVVSYPRTVKKKDGSEPRYQERTEKGKVVYDADTSWSPVSFTEANRVWNDFMNQKSELSFKVTERDIYNPSALFGVLSCRQRAPFVNAMGVFFITDQNQFQDSINARAPARPMVLPEVIKIPNITGMDAYRVTSEAFRSDHIPIRFASESDVLTVFDSSGVSLQSAAQGITPIGTFTLKGMEVFYSNRLMKDLLGQVDEILLVFQYDSLSADRNLSWIPGCE